MCLLVSLLLVLFGLMNMFKMDTRAEALMVLTAADPVTELKLLNNTEKTSLYLGSFAYKESCSSSASALLTSL